MNTSLRSLFPATALHQPTAPSVLSRFLARLVSGGRQAPATVEPIVRHLDKGATTWIRQPRSRQVSCESGALWLCFDGEPEDIVLVPGEKHLCVKASPLSIHALSAGVMRVT